MKLIKENNNDSEFFNSLVLFLKGQISKDQLEQSDLNISSVTVKPKLSESIVTIEFDDDIDLFKIMDLDEHDEYLLSNINSSYSSYEYHDSYNDKEEFLEGYLIFGELDKENQEKLKLIQKLILPGENYDIDSSSFCSNFARKLYSFFESEVKDMLETYSYLVDEEMRITTQTAISTDINEFLNKKGFSLNRSYYKISTTVGNLFTLYGRYGRTNLKLLDLLSYVFENLPDNEKIGGWSENLYEYRDITNFDKNEFNRSIGKNLDRIIETITDSEDSEDNIKDYLSLYDKINEKYGFDKWATLPKSQSGKYSYNITGIELKTGKILVRLRNELFQNKLIALHEENFYKLLYQPELFDMSDIFVD